ncbi:tautomerase family protein [Pseudomonas sp. CFBP 5748]
MPFARLTLSLDLSPDEGRRLCNELTDLIADELGKRQELTSVLIDVPGGHHWTIGGSGQRTAAHLEVCVTAGTNSEEEKGAFMASAMSLLRRTLPDLDLATYIIVNENPATDWGYDGRTQADRARCKT